MYGLDSVTAWTAAEVLHEAIFVLRTSPDLAFEYVSESIVELAGFTAEEHLSDPDLPRRYIVAEDTQKLADVLESDVGVLVECTLRYRGRDGKTVWIEHRLRKVQRSDGSLAMYGAVRNVTDTQMAAEERARAEAEYQLLAENASDIVFRGSGPGLVDWVSPSVTAVLGWPANVIVGSNFQELIHPDDATGAMDVLSGVRSGRAVTYEARFRSAEGDYRWMAVTSRPVYDSDGRYNGIVGSSRDITAEMHARQVSEHTATRLRSAMDAVLDPLIVLESLRDSAGHIVDFIITDLNDAAARHMHGLRETLLGTALLDVVPGQLSAGLVAQYANTVDTGEPLGLSAVPYADEMQGGQLRLFDIRAAKVGDGLSVAFRDVTEQEGAARALAASEARYRMLAEHASDIVMEVAADGTIRWVSDSVHRVSGWSPARERPTPGSPRARIR